MTSKKKTGSRSGAKAAKAVERQGEGIGGDAVIIRKYENRRLYDTSSSRYINIDRVAEMVREGLEVRVVEAKTDRDVTRQVLTQIIVDSSRSKDGPPLEFLRDLVRASDTAAPGSASNCRPRRRIGGMALKSSRKRVSQQAPTML